MKPTPLSALVGQGLHGSALSGGGFSHAGRNPPPLPRVSGLIKKKPQHKDFAPANGPSDTAGGQWIVMGGGI